MQEKNDKIDSQEPEEPTIELARKHFKEWNDSLQFQEYEDFENTDMVAARAKKVAENYAKEGIVFLATKSNEVRTTRDRAEEYFNGHFLSNRPSGEIVSGTEHFEKLSEDCYVYEGDYKFTLHDKNNNTTCVVAEFIFVRKWNPENKKWEIIAHYSAPKNSALKNKYSVAHDDLYDLTRKNKIEIIISDTCKLVGGNYINPNGVEVKAMYLEVGNQGKKYVHVASLPERPSEAGNY